MHDLTVSTSQCQEERGSCKGLDELIRWAKTRLKPGKEEGQGNGQVQWQPKGSVQATCQGLESWLRAVDRSGLPGMFNAWIYQHGILPRILWPLLVYELSIFIVGEL